MLLREREEAARVKLIQARRSHQSPKSGTVAPIPPTATTQTIVYMTEDSDAKVLFLDAAIAGALERIEPAMGVRRVVLDGSSAEQSLSQWLAPADVRPSPVTVGPNEIFNIIYSSGTTVVRRVMFE